jgi:hypothetical protein
MNNNKKILEVKFFSFMMQRCVIRMGIQMKKISQEWII